jgi:hypothetical protein
VGEFFEVVGDDELGVVFGGFGEGVDGFGSGGGVEAGGGLVEEEENHFGLRISDLGFGA